MRSNMTDQDIDQESGVEVSRRYNDIDDDACNK